jgi:2-polyprenyl-3-methyl-5-hydroxy-6-metoxy-1,4-benzoquinol methylase
MVSSDVDEERAIERLEDEATYRRVEEDVHALLNRQALSEAVRIATHCVNTCPGGAPTFPDFLALALTTSALARMHALGISRKQIVRRQQSKELKVWFRRDVHDLAFKTARSFVQSRREIPFPPRPCPYCGTTTGEPVEETARIDDTAFLYFDFAPLRDQLLTIDGKFAKYDVMQWILGSVAREEDLGAQVMRCSNCALEFVNWPFDLANVDRVYQRKLRDHVTDTMCGRADDVAWNREKATFPIFVARMMNGVAGKSIMDFGCAEGIMLWYLKQFGAETVGVENNSFRVAYASAVLGILEAAHDTAWFDAPENRHRFDAIISYHTLEHLFDLAPTFDRLRRVTKPGGMLFVAVPDRQIGGPHTIDLTHDFFRHALPRHGFKVTGLFRDDENLPTDLRDPRTGMPAWSGNSDTLVIAEAI